MIIYGYVVYADFHIVCKICENEALPAPIKKLRYTSYLWKRGLLFLSLDRLSPTRSGLIVFFVVIYYYIIIIIYVFVPLFQGADKNYSNLSH